MVCSENFFKKLAKFRSKRNLTSLNVELGLKPDLPVIITSGFSITGITQELLNNDSVQFLPKPFLSEELLHAIGMVLQL